MGVQDDAEVIAGGNKKAIITGISGQDGAYLAAHLLEKGYEITGILSSDRESNLYRLSYLAIEPRISFASVDLCNLSEIQALLRIEKPDEIYHLAAQSSVGISFQKPYETLWFNCQSCFAWLEATRSVNKAIRFYFSCSGEMYGKTDNLPVGIDAPLRPVSPYAVSKAAGFQTVKMYREVYDMFAVSGIVFNHESFLRPEHFFVKKVIRHGLLIKKGILHQLEVGNIDVKRDFGSAKDYVRAFWSMLQTEEPNDFIIASGTSVSLREIIYFVWDYYQLDRDRIVQNPSFYRPEEIVDIYGDNKAIQQETDWKYDKSWEDLMLELIQEEEKNYG